MFFIGQKVKIKPLAWKKFCEENDIEATRPIPPPQIITDMPSHPPYDDKVLLSFPFYWWNEDDLIPD